MDIERRESKAQILQNYLNIAFFGENSYSIQTAAQTFFNKPVSQLTLPEAALLVGAVRAPAQYDAFDNPAAAAPAAQRGHPEHGRRRRHHPCSGRGVQGDTGEARHRRQRRRSGGVASMRTPTSRMWVSSAST